jgi:hypothetical protein
MYYAFAMAAQRQRLDLAFHPPRRSKLQNASPTAHPEFLQLSLPSWPMM